MSCDEHYKQLFAPIVVVVRERNVSNVIIHYTAYSNRRIIIFKYFIGLRIEAFSSTCLIPKRIKLFGQQLFLQMVISSFGIHRQLPHPVCSVVCSSQPRKDQWRSCRTFCNLCGSGKQTKWLYFLKTKRLKKRLDPRFVHEGVSKYPILSTDVRVIAWTWFSKC